MMMMMAVNRAKQNIQEKNFLSTWVALRLDMMVQRLARRAEDREVPGSSPVRD